MKIYHILLFFFVVSLGLSAQTYDEYIEYSFKYLDNNSLDSSAVALKEALKKEPANPRNVMLLSNLGTIQRRQGKLNEALISYTAALGRAPRNVTFLANRASLFVEMESSENAITDYTALLEMEPNNEDALYRRGLLYLQIKHPDAAQSDFERILEINPNTLNGRIGIASLCKLEHKYDEAERIYLYLMEKAPDNADLYAGRAELYLLMRLSGKALSDVNKAMSLQNKDNPNSYQYMLRARIRLLQHEKELAKSDIEKAIELGYDRSEGAEMLKLCR